MQFIFLYKIQTPPPQQKPPKTKQKNPPVCLLATGIPSPKMSRKQFADCPKVQRLAQ